MHENLYSPIDEVTINFSQMGYYVIASGIAHYTPVHLVESVENCGLCMRWYLACSSYAKVMHQELAIMRALRYDASARD